MHPLILIFMGILLNSIGSNIQSLANGVLSSLIGGKISSGISKDMMNYQDRLNDQNALVAYNRQRQLMGDAALLQKQGMLKAGYNTAFGSNGSVMNAGTPSSSNVGLGSSESKMPNSFQTLLDAKNVESTAKVADSNSKLLDSKKVGQDIDNDYKVANAVADLSNKAADTRDKNAKARANELANGLLSKYGDRLKAAETGKAESDESAAADNAALVSINRQIAQSTRPDKEALAHELVENAKKEGKLLDAQVVTENGKVFVQQSEIFKNNAAAAVSWAQSNLADSQKIAQDIQNAINSDDRVVKAAVTRLINAAREAGPQSFSEYAWSVFNDPNATLGQKWKAGFASILGWVERSLGGESSHLPGQVYDDLKVAATRAYKGVRERLRSKPGKNRIPVWRR
ncbi:hypothetical protein [Leyella stercorea]|uniref:hypothetical protein n=1 Tax=Leyella stercorea TaxID=363265 RepID=UPI0024308C48|nr:hypothetical protein [Leyella stercorea]